MRAGARRGPNQGRQCLHRIGRGADRRLQLGEERRPGMLGYRGDRMRRKVPGDLRPKDRYLPKVLFLPQSHGGGISPLFEHEEYSADASLNLETLHHFASRRPVREAVFERAADYGISNIPRSVRARCSRQPETVGERPFPSQGRLPARTGVFLRQGPPDFFHSSVPHPASFFNSCLDQRSWAKDARCVCASQR